MTTLSEVPLSIPSSTPTPSVNHNPHLLTLHCVKTFELGELLSTQKRSQLDTIEKLTKLFDEAFSQTVPTPFTITFQWRERSLFLYLAVPIDSLQLEQIEICVQQRLNRLKEQSKYFLTEYNLRVTAD